MKTHHVATNVHGRFLHEPRDPARLLIGFHGYAETAEMHMAELQQIPGAGEWSLAAVQALHPFYIRGESQIVANWMTRQDRELAIADNIDYVRRAVAALPRPETLVFLGFSQGAQMAYRAAADFAWRVSGLIILGGDVPPDIAQEGVQLPPTFVARGKRDEWFTDEKLIKDLRFLKGATTVESLVLDAGHEWTAEFRAAAGQFLATMSSRA